MTEFSLPTRFLLAGFLALLLLLCGAGFASLLLFPSWMLVTLPLLLLVSYLLADSFIMVLQQ